MIISTLWTNIAPRPQLPIHKELRFSGDKVIGTWFALNRATGREIWRWDSGNVPGSFVAVPEIICGPDAGVIVATFRDTGVFWRIEEDSGRVLRKRIFAREGRLESHALRNISDNLLGQNGTPASVSEGLIITNNGHAFDVITGEELEGRRTPSPYVCRPDETLINRRNLAISGGRHLRMGAPGDLEDSAKPRPYSLPLRMFLEDVDGSCLWRLDAAEHPLFGDPANNQQFCVFPDVLLFLVSDCPIYTDNGAVLKSAPALFRLLVFEIATGELIAQCDVEEFPCINCKIQDWFGRQVLVSFADEHRRNLHVKLFEFSDWLQR